MVKSLSTECWNSAHIGHIVSVTVPAIALYLVLVPGYLFRMMFFLRKRVLYPLQKNYDPKWTYRFGFLFAGYEPVYCWWEVVVLFRKAGFVLVTIFSKSWGTATQIVSAMLVLIVALSAHLHTSPYDHDEHDVMESAALHAALIVYPIALLANEISASRGIAVGPGGEARLGIRRQLYSLLLHLPPLSSS